MTQHLHSRHVEGCYRCDLSRDEAPTLTERLDDLAKCAAEATSLTLDDDNARDCYHIVQDDVPALVAALRAVLALADHVTETHAALPEPHGAFTRGYATALRDIRAAIEGALNA